MRIEFVMFLPLWKLSSMGGIILYTFPRISFLVEPAIVKKRAKTDRIDRKLQSKAVCLGESWYWDTGLMIPLRELLPTDYEVMASLSGECKRHTKMVYTKTIATTVTVFNTPKYIYQIIQQVII